MSQLEQAQSAGPAPQAQPDALAPQLGGSGGTSSASARQGADEGGVEGVAQTSGGSCDDSAAARQRQAQEEAAREAAADAAAWRALSGVRITLLAGDAGRALGQRAQLAGAFDCVTLGNHHIHLLGGQHTLPARLLRPGGLALVESAQYLLQLSSEQADMFGSKVTEMAAGSGLEPLAHTPPPTGYLAFQRPAM